MRILIVKLSSLGDVVHTMPAVQDIRRCVPGAQVDWVVEKAFAPLVERCEGVERIVPCELRRWRKAPFSRETRAEWRAFRRNLRSVRYDAIIDFQGLMKSAVVSRAARTSEGGKRFAMANGAEGGGYESPTRWVADVVIPLYPRLHAVQRAKALCARALGYEVPEEIHAGLHAKASTKSDAVLFVHGTANADKCWPVGHWIGLGRKLVAQGHSVSITYGNEEERVRAETIVGEIGQAAQVWPRLDLATLTDRIAGCAAVIGVDSGLSHIAVALGLPHVQIYTRNNAWLTEPIGSPVQVAVYGHPAPSLDAVWDAWERVRPRR